MQLSDDKRFQQLPPEDLRELIRKAVEKQGWKYIFIEHTSWYNLRTRCKHDIYNMPILALHNDSNRPIAITTVEISKKKEDSDRYDFLGRYTYNVDYVHQNITTEISHFTTNDVEGHKITLWGHAICNPITQGHFFQMPLENIKPLFVGQLMGQNSGSPFRAVDSVAGTYQDLMIKNNMTGAFIKRSASIVQLLSRCPNDHLCNKYRLSNILQNTAFPTENQVAYKRIDYNHYIIGSVEEMEKAKENKDLSAYYPVITAEMCKDILDNIPRIDIDFGCFGLGSAGSGVLDMLSRSILFEKYMIVDFDTVESKNIRNQWYEMDQIHLNKVAASEHHLKYRQHSGHNIEITSRNDKFETINFNLFKFKYVMSAFDKIQTRLEFLTRITDEKSDVKYLFDARYDELTASIYFIDLQNKEEVDYYAKGLLSDKAAFDKLEAKRKTDTLEKFIQYLEGRGCFTQYCGSTKRLLANHVGIPAEDDSLRCPRIKEVEIDTITKCHGEDCINMFTKFYEQYKEKCSELLLPEEESSCVRQNFIDIYHYASTFIFDAIKAMESDTPKKLFTHIDVTTDPLPNSIILRK